MNPATCKQCGRHSMVPVDASEAEETLAHLEGGGAASFRLSCAYCGGTQATRSAAEIRHAVYEGDLVRQRIQAEVAKEREKVARLQEGRW